MKKFLSITWNHPELDDDYLLWSGRLRYWIQTLERERNFLGNQIRKNDLSELQKSRMSLVLEGKKSIAQGMKDVLSVFKIDWNIPFELNAAIHSRFNDFPHMDTLLLHLFREWSWGEKELETLFSLLDEYLKKTPLKGRGLVINGGYGRLVSKLSSMTDGRITQVDENPWIIAAAERLLSGGNINLAEIPLTPLALKNSSVLRSLPGKKLSSNIDFQISPMNNLMFEDHEFDWIVSYSLPGLNRSRSVNQSAEVNRVLKPKGNWIILGYPEIRRFLDAEPLLIEEIEEWSDQFAFNFLESFAQDGAFMQSPDDCFARILRYSLTSFTKRSDLNLNDQRREPPDWIQDSAKSITGQSFLKQAIESSQFLISILKKIDGKKSIDGIAGELSSVMDIPKDQILPLVSQLLFDQYEKQLFRRMGR